MVAGVFLALHRRLAASASIPPDGVADAIGCAEH
jgi:hypothetical protein